MRWLAFLLVVCLPGCGSRDWGVVVSRIPGTGQVCPLDFSISVSPDEGWLLFTEWTLPTHKNPPGEYDLRIVSLNLHSGELAEHAIESISPTSLGFSSNDKNWTGQLGYEIIKQRFQPAGWAGGRYYFEPYYHDIYPALEPGTPGIQLMTKPQEPRTCSDCYPGETVSFRGHEWELVPPIGQIPHPVSIVVRNGSVAAVYYFEKPGHRAPDHHRSIYRIGREGEPEVLVEEPAKKRVTIQIAFVRVSPDERYLAYTVDSKKRSFFSAHRDEIRVMDHLPIVATLSGVLMAIVCILRANEAVMPPCMSLTLQPRSNIRFDAVNRI